jgi:dihydrodipicolinate synthase/N-acetylneuraminate lyase
MHVGAIGTASAVRAARTARAAGCAAVCCVPPFFFPSSDRSRIEHYRAVADAAGDLPFFVYNLPQLTQVETVPALMEKFVRAIPTLKGLKHSAPNFADIRAFADMGLICFSGNGAFPLPALTMGAVGSIDAPLALAPWHYAELFSAWEAGDMARAQSLQDGVRKYVDLVWMFGAPAHVCKTVLSARLGIDCGRPIPPVNSLTDDEKREVLRVAQSLGLTEARDAKPHAARALRGSA